MGNILLSLSFDKKEEKKEKLAKLVKMNLLFPLGPACL